MSKIYAKKNFWSTSYPDCIEKILVSRIAQILPLRLEFSNTEIRSFCPSPTVPSKIAVSTIVVQTFEILSRDIHKT